MRTTSRLVAFTAVVAVLVVASATASATSLYVSSDDFRITFDDFNIITVGDSTKCDLTLEGHFEEADFDEVDGATVEEVARSTAGHIPFDAEGSCVGGAIIEALSNELPTLMYYSIAGSLPAI